jgi:predicted dienelactone hydrolase
VLFKRQFWPRLRRRALLVALVVAASSCSSGSSSSPRQAGDGPFVAGTTTVSLPYTKVDLWYPADTGSARGRTKHSYDLRDWLPPSLASRVTPGLFTFTTDAYDGVPVSRSGPFPLVLFAHGLYSFRDQSTFLTSWLASRGYIVAAPEFPSNDVTAFFAQLSGPPAPGPSDVTVLADTAALVMRMNRDPTSPVGGEVGPGKIAVIGHSLGGIDSMQFASAAMVGTYIPLAAGFAGAHPPLPAVPSLYMAGSTDHDIPRQLVQSVFDTAPQPKRLVVLANAGHLAFTDMCLVGAANGGLARLGTDLALPLPDGAPFTPRATDGCGRGYLSPQRGWAKIQALVLGELRRYLR